MSNRTFTDAGPIEHQAAAVLRATAAVMVGCDMDRAFESIDGDGLAKGHAWRSIRKAIGYTPPVLWQRSVGREAVLAMLATAR